MPPAPQHAVWQLGIFKKLGRNETECSLCSKTLRTTNHSIGPLITHVNTHAEEREKLQRLLDAGGAAKGGGMSGYVIQSGGALSAMDKAVVYFVASCQVPFHMLKNPTFKMMFNVFHKGSEIKDESWYRLTILPRVYSALRNRVLCALDSCSYLSFTVDIWSGPNASFFSLTAMGITPDWSRMKYVLAVRSFPGRHTSERVHEMVSGLLKEWKVPREKVACFVHDEGSNMIGAFQEFADLEDTDCGAHKLHTIIRPSLFPNEKKAADKRGHLTDVETLFALCRKVVGHFRHSNLAYEKLGEYQRRHGLNEHKLIQDVETRWNSSHNMAIRMLQQKLALDDYFLANNRDLLLSQQQWSLLEDVVSLLEPFATLSQFMCKDASPVSTHIAVRKALLDELGTAPPPTLSKEIELITKKLSDKFDGLEAYRTQGVAHFLDPRFKDSVVADPVKFRQDIADWLHVLLGTPPAEDIEVIRDLQEPPAKRPKSYVASLGARYGKASTSSASQPTSHSRSASLDKELANYLLEPTTDWESDPLVTWKELEKRFPLLASFAKKFLSVPATSVNSEQVFSAAGQLYDPLRSRMTPKTAEMLLFLNRNLPVFNYRI